jgi:hypothetical protein
MSREGSSLKLSDSSRVNSPQIKMPTAPEAEFKGFSTLSDYENVYFPFLKRVAGSFTSEICTVSIKEFIAGILLGHHTQAYDKSVRDSSIRVPNTGVQTLLWLFERPFKKIQIESHGKESDDKSGQETGELESHAEESNDKKAGPTRNQKLVPSVVLSTSTVNILAELCKSLSVSCHSHTNTILRTLYNHVGAFPPVCPEHQRFFQCATGDDFDKLQDLNEVGPISLWHRYSGMMRSC